MDISEYNNDQLQAIRIIKSYIRDITQREFRSVIKMIKPYIDFRSSVAGFQKKYFSKICMKKCYKNGDSACCNSEGIAVFFSDLVINAFYSNNEELAIMESSLFQAKGTKCVYLTDKGCLWRLKPIVCEMFLCDHVKKSISSESSNTLTCWNQLKAEEKKFTWPDKPILFDEIERLFIEKGFDSRLMYFHKSPGLLRLKSKWKTMINKEKSNI